MLPLSLKEQTLKVRKMKIRWCNGNQSNCAQSTLHYINFYRSNIYNQAASDITTTSYLISHSYYPSQLSTYLCIIQVQGGVREEIEQHTQTHVEYTNQLFLSLSNLSTIVPAIVLLVGNLYVQYILKLIPPRQISHTGHV